MGCSTVFVPTCTNVHLLELNVNQILKSEFLRSHRQWKFAILIGGFREGSKPFLRMNAQNFLNAVTVVSGKVFRVSANSSSRTLLTLSIFICLSQRSTTLFISSCTLFIL